uniref:Uncharacterized protein MANES_01G220800 n=1 Tax=Rhizophora mucronata TaxID=61149 RepID=A0A2P2N2Z1_RHIMU
MPLSRLVILLALLITCLAPLFAHGDGKLTAYEVLEAYDFPVGLIPKGVTGYELNRETGEFSAYLDQTCKFPIESYELEYKPTVTGIISKGRLRNLNGIHVKVLFLWLSIVEVERDGDEIDLSVGIASANFPIDNFLESPQCGCGFDCNNLIQESAGLVSSA